MQFIIFDIDGTLSDTIKVDDKCFIKAFKNTFHIDIEHYKWETIQHVTDWGITEEIINIEYNRNPSAEEYQNMKDEFIRLLKLELTFNKKQFLEIPGAVPFVKLLQKNKKMAIGLATGAWQCSAEVKLQSIGLDYNNFAFSNSNYFKSREQILQHTILQLKHKTGSSPDRIIYFGDGVWDYNTCKKLGIDFIGIDYKNNKKLKNIGAQLIFKDYLNPQIILEHV